MRTLHINAVSGISSTGRTCVDIATYLNNEGHDAFIAYSEGLHYIKEYKIGTVIEKKLHAIYSRVFGLQAYFSRNGTRNLLKFIEENKPDIVILSNLHGNYINLKLLLSYIAENDIPTIAILHDCWFYTGKCTHYTVDKCYKWKNGCDDCCRLKKDNPSLFFDRTSKIYNDKKELFEKIPRLAIVGVSDWITNEAKKSFLSSAKKITRIYNWIDIDVFKPVNTESLRHKLKLENKFIILGVASTWSNEKGLDKFVELANIIPEDMVIILVGNIGKEINVPNNIIHINETNNIDELVEYYSMADVFLNLSLEESFGKVTAEALACGTPIIVINSTANPELVGERCGYIIDENNISKILNNIIHIRNTGKNYYSKHCIEYAKNNFNKYDRLRDYLELFEELRKS
ncbi:glycosyltransferase [uncultured Clostridium sp.]|uniref:glycosyltransferase n=1 Tax=uncultured Clostridium sp. TaxID=59620 RepID=UPI002590229B|nr:glycosyltransferase [uncultured Clostridium sp.]